jgi:putative sigma-54 modulation protein
VRTIVKGKNIDVPESVRKYAERKMRRLDRFLDERSEAVVELSSEQHHSSADSQIVAVTLVIDGRTLRGHAAGPTYEAGLDAVIDRIARQAIDFQKKPRDKARPEASRSKRIVVAEPELQKPARKPARGTEGGRKPEAGRRTGPARPAGRPDEAAEEPARSRIVKTKRFAIEPMFEEDAVARMEELGHVFFLFVNAETERLCLLYKRRAGDYGLIEPIIPGQYTVGRPGKG